MKCVRHAMTVLTVVLLSAGGALRAEESDKAPAGASLEGTWSAVHLKDASRELQLSKKSLRFVFSHDTLSMRGATRVIAETKYRTDPTNRPRTINLTYEGKPTLGIYRIEGDELTICLSRSEGERPTRFASGPDSPKQVLFVLNCQSPHLHRTESCPCWPVAPAMAPRPERDGSCPGQRSGESSPSGRGL